MRMILRSIRRFSSSVRYRDHNFYGFVAQRKLWVDSRHRCLYKLSSKPDISMCKHPTTMLSRDLITSAAGVANRGSVVGCYLLFLLLFTCSVAIF